MRSILGFMSARKLAGFLLIAAMVMITACGDGGSGGSNAAASGGTDSGSGSSKEQTLIIGMSAANIPVPDTYPTEGYEGMRFVGYQLYDALVNWDLKQGDKPAELVPGLAESWETSTTDPTMWTFHLRQNVTFHDGTPFNADALIFAFDRIMNPKSEYYNAQLAGTSASAFRYVESYTKVDDSTVTIKTKGPYSFLLYDLSGLLIGSPDAIKKSGADYVNHPVGTGPFKFDSMKQGQELTMVKNENYWNGAPKLDKIVLRPIS
ncbi:hypothetical protein K0U00_40385, partial [Paenibacillus sepulcri]|nr:hypothetical protein [Paenibacillus sepulcri]